MAVEERYVDVDGLRTRYLVGGTGLPLVLLHGAGADALDWKWVMSGLAATHRVYAPDLPGSSGSARPADHSPAFFEGFVAAFLDSLGIERAAVVGNSFGGLVALRVALSRPERVTALVLVDSAGLGRAVSLALRSLALPGYGRLAVAWSSTRPGALQRALGRAMLLFARPWRVPLTWLTAQYRMGRTPGFLEDQLAVVRAQVGLRRQREVLLDQLPEVLIPTLVVWGSCDRVLPRSQAESAVARLRKGSLEIIPGCGHLPHVERPRQFETALGRFLA